MAPTDKRDLILQAALHLFVERGFHGTAVPLIAERAGVGAGTIYRYFADKEALVNELFRYWKRRLGEELLEAMAEQRTWRRRFGRLWQTLYEFSQEHPGVVEFLELHLHGDYLDEESRTLEVNMAHALFGYVGLAQHDDAMADLPPVAVVASVYGAFVGLLRAARLGWLVFDPALAAATEERAWALIRR